MPRFRYSATNLQGRKASGELVARDLESAKQELQARGLTAQELTPLEQTAGPPSLGSYDAEQVVATLAEVSDAQLPLADGLRAAAAECRSRRIAAALHRIAADVDSGDTLEHIM